MVDLLLFVRVLIVESCIDSQNPSFIKSSFLCIGTSQRRKAFGDLPATLRNVTKSSGYTIKT
jgi:hypothetical protein